MGELPILAPVASKLARLIPLLSSDKDGEVFGAARAIGRTLHSAGLDWHDLAGAVTERQPLAALILRSEQAPGQWHTLSPHQRIAWLDHLLASDGLSPWERKFCASVRACLSTRPRAEQSPKQRAILDRLIRAARQSAT